MIVSPGIIASAKRRNLMHPVISAIQNNGGAVFSELLCETEFNAIPTDLKSIATFSIVPHAWKNDAAYAYHPQSKAIFTGSFSRSTSASYASSNGYLKYATAGEPRFEYNPVTLAYEGIWMERSSTSLILHSEDLTQSEWVKTDTPITPNNVSSPDSNLTADLCTEGTAGTGLVYQVSAAHTANATVTGSVFLKRGNHDWVKIILGDTTALTNRLQLWVNLATGVIGTTGVSGTGIYTRSSIKEYKDGWYRVSITGKADSVNTTTILAVMSASADASDTRVNNATRYQWGHQLEALGIPTSYIQTTTATATRSSELLSFSMTGWYDNGQSATWFSEFKMPHYDGSTSNSIIRTGTASSAFYRQRYSMSGYTSHNVNSSGASDVTGAIEALEPLGTNVKFASFFGDNDTGGSVNGGSVDTDVTNDVHNAYTTIFIGCTSGSTSESFNGPLKRVVYAPGRLLNAQYQTMST